MAELRVTNISKVYANGFEAVRGLNLSIADGEFLVLVGPSGCGKSTALRMIAGLEDVTSGEIHIGERLVNAVPAKDRDIAMVFQHYALYPHMTVRENIGFSLKLSKMHRVEAERRILEVAEVLELVDNLGHKPSQLSGGQRQRVAMGRAIIRQPAAFLMDEPLSNLDAKLRVQMRAELAQLQRELAVTTVYVTHDQTEAMTMGDRVAVLRAGELQQVDAPQDLYDHPVNMFVAEFIGSPSMNLFEASLDGTGLLIGSQHVDIANFNPHLWEGLSSYNQRNIVVGIRPEDLSRATRSGEDEARTIQAEVTLVESLGSETFVHLSVDAQRVDAGDPDRVVDRPHSANAVGRFEPTSQPHVGEVIGVALDVHKLHFFDADTGQTITPANPTN